MKTEKTLSLRVSQEIFDKLSENAFKEKISRSSVIKKAIDFYLNQDNRQTEGTEDIKTRITAMEARYNAIVNRLNVIAREVEHLQDLQRKKGF